MPYINKDQRALIDREIENLINRLSDLERSNEDFKEVRKGILNYVLTRLVDGLINEPVSYSELNDVLGAMEGCKLELYRRVISPYEDIKIKENGDIF